MDLWLVGEDFRRIHPIEDDISTIWTDRYTSAGNVEIHFNSDAPSLELIEEDLYLQQTESDTHMIIETIQHSADTNRTVVKGRDLKSIFDRRVNRAAFKAGAYAAIGAAAGHMETSVNENCINSPTTQHNFTKLTVGPHFLPWGGGPEAVRDFGAKTVYAELVSIATNADVGWKVLYVEATDELNFHCYIGEDRTPGNSGILNDVIFDPELDNIANVSVLKSNVGYANIIAVEDQTVTTGFVTFITGSIKPSEFNLHTRVAPQSMGNERKEDYTEAYWGELRQTYSRKGAKDHRLTRITDGQILSDGPFQYGFHYGLGDLIAIGQNSITQQKARVVEHIWSRDASGITRYPTFKTVEG